MAIISISVVSICLLFTAAWLREMGTKGQFQERDSLMRDYHGGTECMTIVRQMPDNFI